MMIPVVDAVANKLCIKCGINLGTLSDDWDNLTEDDFVCLFCHTWDEITVQCR